MSFKLIATHVRRYIFSSVIILGASAYIASSHAAEVYTHVRVELATLTCIEQQDVTFDDHILVTWWADKATCESGSCAELMKASGNLEFHIDEGQTVSPNVLMFEAKLRGGTKFEANVTFYEQDGVVDGDDFLGKWNEYIVGSDTTAEFRPFNLNDSGARYEGKMRVRREKIKE